MDLKRKFYNIQKNADQSVDIFIYGLIGYNWYSDENREASEFVSEFKELEKNFKRINIRINSPGGIIEEGLPIFNAIKTSKAETHSYIDGIAYSMAAIIALAADTVHSAKNGLFLLHNASGWSWGNAQDFRETADELDKYDSSLITAIEDKTGLTEEEIRNKWFDYKDHLFTAKEALEAKLIDVIDDSEATVPDGIENWNINKVMAFYNELDSHVRGNFFDKFFDKIKSVVTPPANTPKSATKQDKQDMKDLKKFIDALGLGEDATVDQVLQHVNTMKGDLTTAQTDLQAAQDNLNSVNTLLDGLHEDVAGADTHEAKINVIKTKLAAKPGTPPSGVTSEDPKDDDVDWDVINGLKHNKEADAALS
jgi:ATP-dependent Clp protease, protease subunit